MAKRKSNPSTSINEDIVRALIVAFLLLAAAGIAWAAMASYITGSGLFTVHRVTVAAGLGGITVPELKKLEGRNIFKVDLAGIEARVRDKYPQMADLKILRRFPDEIVVAGSRRELFAVMSFGGRLLTVSRDGFMIGAPGKDDGGLVLVKGVPAPQVGPGERVTDSRFDLARRIIEAAHRENAFVLAPLQAIDMSDPVRIVCSLGEAPAKFEVIVDMVDPERRVKVLATIISRTGIALAEVKYIDLRFKEPLIGKKKAKK